jgi:tetratricopeptide (TPR) repeat protein
LVSSSAAGFDEAVSRLEEALVLEPHDQEVLSDLAAAYLVRAEVNDDPRDLLAAVTWSEEALRLDSGAVEAHFNLSLALEKLHLDAQAREAWSDYLANDGASPWASEAEARRKALEKMSIDVRWQGVKRLLAAGTFSRQTPKALVDVTQQARLYLEDEVLSAWADASAAGDLPRAAVELRRAAVLAPTLMGVTGDTLLTQAVELLTESESPSFNSTKRRDLIEGHRLYRDGRRLYEEQNHDAAKPVFEHAQARLESAGSPIAQWAAFYIAVCDYHASDYRLALRELKALLARVGASSYPSLRGHVEWMIGLTQLDRARYADAVLAFQEALVDFQTARETENVAAMHNLLSRGYEALGADLDAWRHRYAALARLGEVGKDRRVNNILSSAVDGAVEEGRLSVARRFQSEMVRQTRLSGNPLLLTIALHKDASLAARLGHQQEAVAALSEAKGWCGRIPGSGVRARVTADLFMAEGEVLRAVEPQASLIALEQSLALFREQGARVRLVTAERQRARTLEVSADATEVGAAYRAAIAEAEDQLDSVPQEELLAFASETRHLYDDFIAFAAGNAGADEVFSWTEQARGAYLHAAFLALQSTTEKEDHVRSIPLPTPSLASLRAALPQGAILVEFKLLPDRLLRWTLTPETARFRQTPIDPVALAGEVASLRERVRKRASLADLHGPLARLGELVLGNMTEEFSTGRLLVVVPDGPLAALPFDLLLSPGDERPLVERLPVLSAPSASLFLASSARLAALGMAAPRTVLALGNPTFERRLFPNLPNLPNAVTEAERIGSTYRQAKVFTEGGATRAVLESYGPASDVIHFAGHAVLNERDVWRSSLLLARDAQAKDSGVFTVTDLARLHLPQTRLVVLAACDTAGGYRTVSDGTPLLLVPLLAAGVPSLVAALWEVDDTASSVFFEEFHRRIETGESPITALRKAKLLLLNASEKSLRAPAIWAPFTLLGGIPPSTARTEAFLERTGEDE